MKPAAGSATPASARRRRIASRPDAVGVDRREERMPAGPELGGAPVRGRPVAADPHGEGLLARRRRELDVIELHVATVERQRPLGLPERAEHAQVLVGDRAPFVVRRRRRARRTRRSRIRRRRRASAGRPQSWSAVLSIFASTTGLRYGTTSTSVPKRSVVVSPAPKMQHVSGSNQRGAEMCAA